MVMTATTDSAGELALTPDARGRTGITDTDPHRDDVTNPFAG
jgi:hypothetical protein